ncbi:CgeB family protein [Priestia aryabhattai]|uniref:CgeB family protein n=1 Tax=Priestia TaxID=2800373 RepID=UPI001C8D2F29|nr:glycosyltransferase [Priestia aryabhattai]MBY0074700.1 glycosyltransferase [Priestia aryabhattai]
MRILYIPSGFFGIYQFFDECIIRECTNAGHICNSFSSYKGLDSLKYETKKFKPDFVLTMVGFIFPKEMTDWLRNENVKLVVWMTEDPYYMDTTKNLVSRYDYVFTIESSALNFYCENGHPSVYLLPLGTDPNVFSPKENTDTKQMNDICFVGFPYPKRVEMINFLLKKTSYTVQVAGRKWKDNLIQWSDNKQLSVVDWIPPTEVAHHYNHSRIVLNTHRPYDLAENKNSLGIRNYSINNRTFDIAASGAFQIISYKPDLRNYFTEAEMVSFQNKEELLCKINYYIKHKEEREKIASRAKAKVLSQHTFSHRIKEIISTIQKG